MNGKIFIYMMLAIAIIFLIGPFIIIFAASFSESEVLSFPPKGFTLHWFKKVITMPMFIKSFETSLWLAVLASLLALLLGIPVAYILARYDFPGKRFVEILTTLPVIIPQMVAGLALLRIFIIMGIFSIKTTLLIGHTAIVLPFAVRIISSSVLNLPYSIEEAAISLGASRFRVFVNVVLPNTTVGIISAFILTFITSFNNVPISLFLTGPGISTLPIVMMTYMEYYYDPSIAALATLLILITLGVVLTMQKLLGVSKMI